MSSIHVDSLIKPMSVTKTVGHLHSGVFASSYTVFTSLQYFHHVSSVTLTHKQFYFLTTLGILSTGTDILTLNAVLIIISMLSYQFFNFFVGQVGQQTVPRRAGVCCRCTVNVLQLLQVQPSGPRGCGDGTQAAGT